MNTRERDCKEAIQVNEVVFSGNGMNLAKTFNVYVTLYDLRRLQPF